MFVNRVWQQHFGTGLVATPNDFGFTGARPTHPELLDRLALDFVDGGGWSVKRLHRQIVLSAAYRRDSRALGNGVTIDPENRLLWRQNVRRLDAETLRDALLAVSGTLLPYSAGKPIWRMCRRNCATRNRRSSKPKRGETADECRGGTPIPPKRSMSAACS